MNASLGCWREEFNENIKQYLIQTWPTLNKTFVTLSFFKNTPPPVSDAQFWPGEANCIQIVGNNFIAPAECQYLIRSRGWKKVLEGFCWLPGFMGQIGVSQRWLQLLG